MRTRNLVLGSIASALLLPAVAAAQSVPTYAVEKLINMTTIADPSWSPSALNDRMVCVGNRDFNGVTQASVMFPPAQPLLQATS